MPVSRKALIFDETIEQWIRSGSRTILLERALGLALETFPCSMTVFGILQVAAAAAAAAAAVGDV